MNVSAAASVPSDLLAANAPAVGNPPSETSAGAPQGAKSLPPSRAGHSSRSRGDGPNDFERTLRDELDAGPAGAPEERAERHMSDAAAAASKDGAREAAEADDGDDAPPDGNGLPPWLPVLPPVTTREPSATAGAAVPASATSPTVAASTDPILTTTAEPAGDVAAPVAASPESIETTADVGDSLPALPNGKALPEQARADGPAARAAAWRESARFAPSPAATPAPDVSSTAPPPAPDATVDIVRAAPPRAAAAALPNASGAAERRPAPAIGTPDPATLPIDAPVEPLSRHAVEALLATAETVMPPTPSPDSASAASMLAAASATATAPASAPAPAATATPLQIPVAVGAPDWDRQLSDKVQVLVDQGLSNAQLKLSPAHLGPLEIRISLQNDQANVWFGTHSHATREALEAAAPRLRDALGAQGFANVGVSVDLQQQASRGQTAGQGGSRYEPEFSFAAGAATPSRTDAPRAATRGVDTSRLDAFA